MPFTFSMPKLSPTMTEGTIAKWYKKEGEFVKSGDLLCEISTDKSTNEYTALEEGWLRKILVKEGESAELNCPLAIFSQTKDEPIDGYLPQVKKEIPLPETPVTIQQPQTVPIKKAPEEGRLLVSPLARKMAKDRGIDLRFVHGSGPDGRIVARDIASAHVIDLPIGDYEEKTLSPMRKAIARRLSSAKREIPHFYISKNVDASPLLNHRKDLEKAGSKVTVNDIIIRASALALKKNPEMNTGFHTKTESILHFKSIDIAVAVTIKEGLITPIIKNADQKSLIELSTEMKALKTKALEGKLKEDEYRGGSFTISNLGMFGISEFTAIINPPQAAILAIGSIEDRALVKGGTVVAGKAMTLTLSLDHRVIDGALAATFMQTLAELLESPLQLN